MGSLGTQGSKDAVRGPYDWVGGTTRAAQPGRSLQIHSQCGRIAERYAERCAIMAKEPRGNPVPSCPTKRKRTPMPKRHMTACEEAHDSVQRVA